MKYADYHHWCEEYYSAQHIHLYHFEFPQQFYCWMYLKHNQDLYNSSFWFDLSFKLLFKLLTMVSIGFLILLLASLLDRLRKYWTAQIPKDFHWQPTSTPRGDHLLLQPPNKTKTHYLHISASQVPELFNPVGFIDSFNILSSTFQRWNKQFVHT